MLASGNFSAAAQSKKEQIERLVNQRDDQGRQLARSYYELGLIDELRLDFLAALQSFRRAWEIEQTFDFGFKYAQRAQFQQDYTTSRPIFMTRFMQMPLDQEELAMVLNNVGLLYYSSNNPKAAEKAYVRALEIWRTLASKDPGTWLRRVATTLNCLGLLCCDMNRTTEAEKAYKESIEIHNKYVKSEDLLACSIEWASTQNNLAILYIKTHRYEEAGFLLLRLKVAYLVLESERPGVWLFELAGVHHNLGLVYSGTNRANEAQGAYKDALRIYGKLAEANPDALMPAMADTLFSVAGLYREYNNMQDLAEQAYRAALETYLKRAKVNPSVFLPKVVKTLVGMAYLYINVRRRADAENACEEAERLLKPLWESAPEVHGDLMSTVFGTKALVFSTDGAKSHAKSLELSLRANEVANSAILKEMSLQYARLGEEKDAMTSELQPQFEYEAFRRQRGLLQFSAM